MNRRRLTVGSLKEDRIIATNNKAVEETRSFVQTSKQSPEKVKVLQNNKVYQIIPNHSGVSLLDIALMQNQSLSYKCKKGKCGLCAVKVLDGSSFLSEMSKQERKKITEGTGNEYRLSCQAFIQCPK